MLGIGGHLQKYTKIKIQGNKSKDYNTKYEELEKTGLKPEEIAKVLDKEEFEKRHTDTHYEPQPYKVNTGMQGLGGSLTMSFENAHKTKSQAQAMQTTVDANFRATKDLKSKGLPVVDPKKRQEEIEANKKIKNRICQDHLAQTVEGVDYGQKKQSDYGGNFVHNQQFQKEVEGTDMTFHQKKNDLKWYSEQYVKSKLSLRK